MQCLKSLDFLRHFNFTAPKTYPIGGCCNYCHTLPYSLHVRLCRWLQYTRLCIICSSTQLARVRNCMWGCVFLCITVPRKHVRLPTAQLSDVHCLQCLVVRTAQDLGTPHHSMHCAC